MLEAVEEREHDAWLAVDARDRIVETIRLHRNEQEIDGLLEPFVGLEPLEMLVVVKRASGRRS